MSCAFETFTHVLAAIKEASDVRLIGDRIYGPRMDDEPHHTTQHSIAQHNSTILHGETDPARRSSDGHMRCGGCQGMALKHTRRLYWRL